MVYVLKPTTIMCDSPLSFEVNDNMTHLLQTTKGGYVIVWDLDIVYEAFWKRSGRDREYNMFPVLSDHSVAIDGLIFCGFYGHVFVMITQKG